MSMFSKQIDKINHLLVDGKEDQLSVADSLGRAPPRTSRTKMHSIRISSSTPKPRYQSEIALVRQDLPTKYSKIL
jgi:hypothetical protein